MISLFKIFKIVAFLEGLSYILLLGIATPVKYLLNDPSYVKLLGMPHGLLFVSYIVLAFLLKPRQQWSFKVFVIIVIASVIPFGTFYIDRRYLKY